MLSDIICYIKHKFVRLLMTQSILTGTNYSRHPILILLVSFLLLAVGVYGITQLVLPLQGTIVQPLILLMTSIGILLTIVSVVLYKTGTFSYLKSLRVILLLMVVVIVGTVIFYLWVLSEALFSN